ncbi:MAG: hypothetical protein KDA36_06945 [Planctomycetaceae bacterium]|nr:hypothetical protein [Planctomycetaceae bacterium]
MRPDRRGFLEALVGDGRALISLSGLCLVMAGGFVIFQASTGHFLPHDIAFLKMLPQELCGINECRIVHFMIHDRISFGGAIFAIGVMYLWLAEFPLKEGAGWAWWTLLASGVTGFGSFLTYLGYGYLDLWHGIATLLLLPCFIAGLWKTRRLVIMRDPTTQSEGNRLSPGVCCLLAATCGMIGGGMTIQWIGMTSVFVTTDLEFMGLSRETLDSINPRLVPLIAHDRAGFGGAVATAGLLTLASVWFGGMTRSLRQALLIGGVVGWGTAIFVHPAIGYTDPYHLAPAVGGGILFLTGLLLTLKSRSRATDDSGE